MFLCNWFWFVLQNAVKGQYLVWIRAARLWRHALTLRSIMNNKSSLTLRILNGISDATFSVGIFPFQIHSSSIFIHYTSCKSPFHIRSISIRHLLEVCWWIYLPDLQRMYNDTLWIQNGNEMDEYRTKRMPTGRSPDISFVGCPFKVLNMLKIFHRTKRTSTDKMYAKWTCNGYWWTSNG